MQLVGKARPSLCNPRLDRRRIRVDEHPVEIGEVQAMHITGEAKDSCLLTSKTISFLSRSTSNVPICPASRLCFSLFSAAALARSARTSGVTASWATTISLPG